MSDRLRVGLDVTSLVGPPSGIHQATRGLIEELVTRPDLDVRGWLLTARGARPAIDVPIRRSRVPAQVAHRLWARGTSVLDRVITGPVDVIHGTNFTAPPGPRSVISVQDLSLVRHPEWCRPEVTAMVQPLKAAIRHGATVHVSSEAIAQEVREHLDVSEAKIAVVHHGVRPIVGGAASEGRRLAGHDRYVLVLGTVEHRKNVAAVTEALYFLPDDVAIVVAGPPGNAEGTLSGVIDHPRFVRLPDVDEPTRASLLRGASVLAFPSHYEGFGLPPLEALSLGTPVVATAVGALPELIGDETPLVSPNDDQAFVETLLAVLERPTAPSDQLRSLIAAMTWRRAAAQMVEVYRRIAAQTGGDPASR